MQNNNRDTDSFVKAVEEDSYAELPLPCGAVLITDWEGNSMFNPYVEPSGAADEYAVPSQELEDAITENINELLDVHIVNMNYSLSNGVYYVGMERPE